MRIRTQWLVAFLALAAFSASKARGDIILSTLPQSNDDTFSTSLTDLRFKAIAFTMPGVGNYRLDSAVLRLALDGTPFTTRIPTTPTLRLMSFAGNFDAPGPTTLLTCTSPAFQTGI